MGSLTSRHARALMRLPRGNQIDIARVISEYHLSSRLSDRLVTAYLEAEDVDQQREILAHPEHIIWYQWDLPEDPYDSSLSDYGNELMQEVMNIWLLFLLVAVVGIFGFTIYFLSQSQPPVGVNHTLVQKAGHPILEMSLY